LQGTRQRLRTGPIALEQMKGHSLCRLDTHAGQAPQGLN
jgi:hypothetical protein